MIVVVDYGMGNLKSVQNAADFLGVKVKVSDSKNTLKRAKKIVFPGVGHFGRTVKELRKRKIFNILRERINEGVPFLGICIGMQVLFDSSQESPGVKGLGLIKGRVKSFKSKELVVPHMGWNQVGINKQSQEAKDNKLFKGVKDKSYFYFVHSYYCVPEEKDIIITTTNYGVDFASSIHKDNIWALQFHTEKSQRLGLRVFNNFIKLC